MLEPTHVHPQNGANGAYTLLDGHIRYDILKERGDEKALCLIATDDEAFTYNHKVSQVSPIQSQKAISIPRGAVAWPRGWGVY